MWMWRCLAVLAVGLGFVALGVAQDAPLLHAQGTVEKLEKDQLTIRPRGPDGKFGKNVTLKLTGTSKVTTVSTQKRDKKAVVVQRDTDPKDLAKGQVIAVIYTTVTGDSVLLAAVVQPADGK